jgi:hypothetical protein
VQEGHWIDTQDLWRNWVKEGEIITLPDRAGLGVEMNEEGVRKAQFQERRGLSRRRAADGSSCNKHRACPVPTGAGFGAERGRRAPAGTAPSAAGLG